MAEPNPTEKALEDYARYMLHARQLGVVGHRGGLKATETLLQMCDLQPHQCLLEVGCGSGHTACTVAKRFGASVVAGDLAPHLLARTRERARAQRVEERVAPVQMDTARLPFAEAVEDGLICESVLALIEDRASALREFYRVLKPGGFLANSEVTILKTPPPEFLAAIRNAAARVPGGQAVPVDPDEHQRLLQEVGFVSPQLVTGGIGSGGRLTDQVKIDGLGALKPMLSTIFDRQWRRRVYNREVGEAQRTFAAHTGYGLFFARKPNGS